MTNNIQRKSKSAWETSKRWLWGGVFLSIAATGVLFLEDRSSDAFRMPMSYSGFLLGVVAVFLGFLSLMYSDRKHNLVGLFKNGSMVSWLFSHVTLGAISLVFAILHVAEDDVTFEMDSSWLLMLVFGALVLSGMVWRWIYDRHPQKVQPEIRNYSRSYALDRSHIKMIEIDKKIAGRSQALQDCVQMMRKNQKSAVSPEMRTKIPQEELPILEEIEVLMGQQLKHQHRVPKQVMAHMWLQIWRIIHIPAAIAVLVLLPLHVVVAGSNTKLISHNSFASAKECASCHQEIYEEWRTSMHAYAIKSPVTIAQTRGDLAHGTLTKNKNVQDVCINCHAPLAYQEGFGNDDLEELQYGNSVASEGVTCVVCHQFEPQSSYDKTYRNATVRNSGIGSWLDFVQNIKRGRTVQSFERSHNSNMYHDVKTISTVFESNTAESDFCASCHNVHIDRKDLGMPKMLKLQSIYDEWTEMGKPYGSCIACHSEPGSRGHQFIGVDYPLDDKEMINETRSHREHLVKDAIVLSLDAASMFQTWSGVQKLKLTFTLQNQNVGHLFPAGFAFARQSWVEVKGFTSNGRVVPISGVLENDQDDLCDGNSYDDALGRYMKGCTEAQADVPLINFQKILQDDNGKETPLQHAEGDVGQRAWIAQSCSNASTNYPIPYQKSLTCTVDFPISQSITRIEARLRLRNLPPYFLRAMHEKQPSNNKISLDKMIENLEILDISSDAIDIQ